MHIAASRYEGLIEGVPINMHRISLKGDIAMNIQSGQFKPWSPFRGLSKLGFAVTAALLLGNAAAAPPVTTGMVKSNFDYVTTWFSEARGCENIQSYVRAGNKRSIVEAVLTCQALKLGGYKGEYKMLVTPNYTRAMLQAANGETTMPSETLWTDELDEKKFYTTKPLLADGDFVVGVFVPADKVKSYSIKSVADLKKLKGVTSSLWVKDWATLKDMGVELLDTPTDDSMFKMIAADRAQFTLWSFNSNPNFEVTLDGLTMAALPGVKIYLHGERSLAVSRAVPHGKVVFEALNKGIDILRANGTLARALRESGFINKRAESWTALN